MNNATVNFRVAIVFHFLEYVPRSVIAWSNGNCLLFEEELDCSPFYISLSNDGGF